LLTRKNIDIAKYSYWHQSLAYELKGTKTKEKSIEFHSFSQSLLKACHTLANKKEHTTTTTTTTTKPLIPNKLG
jgi:hypothetical protein